MVTAACYHGNIGDHTSRVVSQAVESFLTHCFSYVSIKCSWYDCVSYGGYLLLLVGAAEVEFIELLVEPGECPVSDLQTVEWEQGASDHCCCSMGA